MIPESIDYTRIKPMLLAALDRRHAARRAERLPRQITAAAIARRFAIRSHGSIDSQKRGVRLIIEALRSEGVPVLATFKGYYLGGDAADFARYRDFRRRSGLEHLAAGAAAMRSTAHDDAAGQLGLFNGPAKAAR